MTRGLLVSLHRWAGLGMAGFLILVGLTGSLLAFWLDINHWLTPDLYPTPRVGIEMDAATLARCAEAIVPQARATTVYLGVPGSTSVGMEARKGFPPIDFEYIHLDPIDGHELGRTTWRGLPKTRNDIMPFVYGLHMYLATSGIGDWILGFVALVWTMDCFVSFCLTAPPPAKRARKTFLARWKPSWQVKITGSLYRGVFDLHRAGGLWLWAILLVYAWSSVYFTLPTFYTRTVGLFAAVEQPIWARAAAPQNETRAPMDWEPALATGVHRMEETARKHGFTVERPLALYHHRAQGLYEYRVRSSRDIGDRYGATAVYFDSSSGETLDISLPTGHRGGTTFTTWIVELHTANLFGLPYRIFVAVVGVIIAMLSVTGVYIWLKKRTARRAAARDGRRALRGMPAAATQGRH